MMKNSASTATLYQNREAPIAKSHLFEIQTRAKNRQLAPSLYDSNNANLISRMLANKKHRDAYTDRHSQGVTSAYGGKRLSLIP